MSAPAPKPLREVGHEAPYQVVIVAGIIVLGGVGPGNPGTLCKSESPIEYGRYAPEGVPKPYERRRHTKTPTGSRHTESLTRSRHTESPTK